MSKFESIKTKTVIAARSGAFENSKENFKTDNYNLLKHKIDSAFKINSGLREYNIERVKDIFVVKPTPTVIDKFLEKERMIALRNIHPVRMFEEKKLLQKPSIKSADQDKEKPTLPKTMPRPISCSPPAAKISKIQMSNPKISKVQIPNHRISKVQIPNHRISKVQIPNHRKSKVQLSNVQISKGYVPNSQTSKVQTANSKISKMQISSPRPASGIKTVSREQSNIFTKPGREFLNLVNTAIKSKKIFMIGNQGKKEFPTIRSALKKRGWVEKCSAEQLSEDDSIHPKVAEVTSRLLKEAQVNFVWVISYVDFSSLQDDVIVSRFPKRTHFSTKIGLWSFMEEFKWFYIPNVSCTITPKTFKVSNELEMNNFIKEFGLSACVALLKIIIDQVANAENDSFFRKGKVPLTVFDFANAQCSEYILHRQHDDLDRIRDKPTTVEQWSEYLTWFYQIAHGKEHFETTSYPMIQALYTMSKVTLRNIEPYWHLLDLEGSKNLWIIKPPADFCGRGVKVMNNIEDIINHVQLSTEKKTNRYIIQKYIERPLLIYDTKFDIRQWFLVTNVYPLEIWIYKECYLRFSSQTFSLTNLHESVHLTNNAIQRNYNNCPTRDSRLPKDNMWHCFQFQEYLSGIGEKDIWKNKILPGIREGIVGAVLASQEEMIERPNSFELYGADFLLGYDYTPILLEINMGPAMAPSTSVTAKLCKSGLEDLIKVVIDRRTNPEADTGKFEILYVQEMGPRQNHNGLDLTLLGTVIHPIKRIIKKEDK